MVYFKFRALFLIAITFLSGVLYAQNEEDVLRERLNSTHDQDKIYAYIALGEYYGQTSGVGDSAIFYGNDALRISNRLKNPDLSALALSLKGLGYATNKDYNSAKEFLQEGIDLVKNSNKNYILAELHTRIASVYENLNELPLSIENFLEAIAYSEKSKNYKFLTLSYYGISVIYSKQEQYDKQLEYLQKALKLIRNENSVPSFTKSVVLSSASQQFSILSGKKGNETYTDSSFIYAQKALEISKKNNLVQRIPSDLLGISLKYANKGEYDASLTYLNEALQYTNTMREDTKLNLFQILAYIYRGKADKEMCYTYLDSLNNLTIKNQPHYGAIISKYSHITYKYFKDHDLAYKALDDYFEFERKKREVEQNKTINELETKYKTALKDTQIRKLWIFLIIALAIIFLGGLILKWIQLRKTREKNVALKEAIKQQIALEKELINVRQNIAQDFHDDLGNKLARISLLTALVEDELTDVNESIKDRIAKVKEDSVSLYVGTKDFIFSLKPDSDELEELVTYLTDFGEDFFQDASLKFIVNKQVDENVKLPHYWTKQLIFIFKEAMTNVLKHANATEIKLHFECQKNNLKVTCQDNGKGFSKENNATKNGLYNMKTRAEKIGGLLKIISEEGKGTTISFQGVIKK